MKKYLLLFLPYFLFAQSTIEGLKLHLRADQGITLINERISAWSDVSGIGATETFTQGTVGTQPILGNINGFTSVHFDSAQWLICTNDAEIEIGTSDFSFDIWIYAEANTAGMHPFGNFVAVATSFGWTFYWQAGTPSTLMDLRIGDGSGTYWVNKTITYSHFNEIAHIAFSLDRDGSQKLYINGAEAATQTISNSINIIGTALQYRIGARLNNTLRFEGDIFEVRIYKKALTPSEILANYNAGIFESNIQTNIYANEFSKFSFFPDFINQ